MATEFQTTKRDDRGNATALALLLDGQKIGAVWLCTINGRWNWSLHRPEARTGHFTWKDADNEDAARVGILADLDEHSAAFERPAA